MVRVFCRCVRLGVPLLGPRHGLCGSGTRSLSIAMGDRIGSFGGGAFQGRIAAARFQHCLGRRSHGRGLPARCWVVLARCGRAYPEPAVAESFRCNGGAAGRRDGGDVAATGAGVSRRAPCLRAGFIARRHRWGGQCPSPSGCRLRHYRHGAVAVFDAQARGDSAAIGGRVLEGTGGRERAGLGFGLGSCVHRVTSGGPCFWSRTSVGFTLGRAAHHPNCLARPIATHWSGLRVRFGSGLVEGTTPARPLGTRVAAGCLGHAGL